MSGPAYLRLLDEAVKLPPEEQRLLVERLSERLRRDRGEASSPPQWRDYAGTVPHPVCGEDAQAWVSRTRQVTRSGCGTHS